MASIRCGSCKGRHGSARAVKACYEARKAIWQIPAAPGFLVCDEHGIESADESVACNDRFAAQQEGEIWAEDAWLRAAEAGDPASWREEELERMAAASGLPVPPGFY
jgi:hypothetical protein